MRRPGHYTPGVHAPLPTDHVQRWATLIRSAWLLAALLLALATGALAAQGVGVAATVAAALLAACLVALYLRHLELGAVLVLLAILPGQVLRLSLGTDPRGGSAMLLTDLLLVPLVTAWVLRKLTVDRRLPRSALLLPLATFTLVALASYVAGIPFVLAHVAAPGKPLVVALMYWGRYLLYALGLLVALDLLRTARAIERALALLLGLGVLLAVAGFIQLWLVPDFTAYAVAAGWDPHQGRLLSTFFDPNFMGSFFAMDLAVVLALLFDPSRSVRWRSWVAAAGAVIFVAFLLTFSRGALLGFLAAFALVTLLRSPRTFVIGSVAVALSIVAVPRLAQRITEGLSVDETGVKRIESWTKAVKLLPSAPLLGVGYNHLATVQDALGLVTEDDVNNRGGVENSLLTVAVTTGLLGALAFLWLHATMLLVTLRSWWDRRLPPRARHLGLGVAGAIVAVIVASTTLNALLYPFILLELYALLAIVEGVRGVDAAPASR